MSFKMGCLIILILVNSRTAFGIVWTSICFPGSEGSHIADIDGSNVVGSYDNGLFLYDGTDWRTLNLPGTVEGISGNYILTYSSGYYLFDGTINRKINVPGGITGISGNLIVGITNAQTHGYVYDIESGISTIMDFPGSTASAIMDIDGRNMIGAYSMADGSRGKFLYDGANWQTLPIATAYGISGHIILGYDGVYDYITKTWTSVDLHSISDKVDITGIDGNRIFGSYYDHNDRRTNGYIVFIPEPATMLLFALGGVVLRKFKVQSSK